MSSHDPASSAPIDIKPRSRVVTDGIEATTSRGMLRAVGMGDADYLKVVNDSLGLAAELEAQMAHVVATYQCEWKTAVTDPAVRTALLAEVDRAAHVIAQLLALADLERPPEDAGTPVDLLALAAECRIRELLAFVAALRALLDLVAEGRRADAVVRLLAGRVADLQHGLGEFAGRVIGGALEHQMFEKMREAGFAGGLSLLLH